MEQNLIEKLKVLQEQNEVSVWLSAGKFQLSKSIQQLESKVSSKQPRTFLRAHLPNQQRTSVSVVAGMKLSSALAKALSRRNLTWNFCEVYCTENGTESVIPCK